MYSVPFYRNEQQTNDEQVLLRPKMYITKEEEEEVQDRTTGKDEVQDQIIES